MSAVRMSPTDRWQSRFSRQLPTQSRQIRSGAIQLSPSKTRVTIGRYGDANVQRHLRPKPTKVIVTMGGGGLGMSINKCTGTVSEVAFSR